MSSAWAMITHQDTILMIRRSFRQGRPGQWCLPGGTLWKRETPEQACVRETWEETGLNVSIDRRLATFSGHAHYFLCTLAQPDATRPILRLKENEAIDAKWIATQDILQLGTIMDFRRLVPLFELAELSPPVYAPDLRLAVPD